jgi:uncharacterized delta-60 repeat protein
MRNREDPAFRRRGSRSESTLVVGALLALATTMISTASADPTHQVPLVTDGAGDLDPTFGENGMVTTDVGPDGDSANAIAIQPDGKIVVAGEASFAASFGLVRYTPDGALDATFGGGGIVTTDIAPPGAYAMALQADGKIVAAGGGRRFALVRYTPVGDLDPTFGGDGVVTTNFNPEYDLAYAVAIQADGKIVAAGVSSIEARKFLDDTKIAVARYNADGSLDTSFGGDGRVTTNFTGTYDAARAAVIQADGRIVVAGTAGGYRTFALVRYNSDGTRDSSFGSGGRVTTNFSRGSTEFVASVALQTDGRIVAVGAEPSAVGFALARYETNGALDPTFGDEGTVLTDFLTRHDLGYTGGWASGVAIQTDGKIVVAGGAPIGSGGDTQFALARYQPDGSLDPMFGDDGKVATEWSIEGNDSAFDITIQTDGKIVAGGTTDYFGPEAMFALARYLPA